jgi:hypothetical protein
MGTSRTSPPSSRAKGSSKLVVGLFVEGSRGTDPLRDDFETMWRLLCAHCEHQDIDLHVFGISKGNIIELRDLKPGRGATSLVRGVTQGSGGKDPLDIIIQRAHARHRFDRVVIAFDLWAPNQEISAKDRRLPCPMRPEVAFVLEKLVDSEQLDSKFKRAAQALLGRYRSRDKLQPRTTLGAVEVIFMAPMFEALFVADETTVRRALGATDKKPKDWPKFKTHERELDKAVLDPAIEAATGKKRSYLNAKSRWGHVIVKAAAQDAALWRHPIATRLCRLLCQ